MPYPQIAEVIESLWDDFTHNQLSFVDTSGGGATSTEGIEVETDREAAQFFTLAAALDLQRDAIQHWQTCKTLWRNHHWVYEPTKVTTRGQEQLATLFEQQGFRWPSKDATWWYENAAVLEQEVDGDAMTLFEEFDFDAIRIYAFADDHFYGLGGKKVGPQWLKVIHNKVHELDRLHELPIPVDIHVKKVTNELRRRTGHPPFADGDTEAIQQFWEDLTLDHDLPPPIIFDTALWTIGSNWDSGGRSYLISQLEE